MINTFKQQLEVFSKAIGIRNRRNEILASNIANAATPNYKARDVDFEVELCEGDLLGASVEGGVARREQVDDRACVWSGYTSNVCNHRG